MFKIFFKITGAKIFEILGEILTVNIPENRGNNVSAYYRTHRIPENRVNIPTLTVVINLFLNSKNIKYIL